jgi:Tol biopolymer transport system component
MGPDGAATLIDPLVIMIDSERGGTLDVFVATRTTATAMFDTPTAVFELDSALNEGNPPAPLVELANAAADSDPWISPDGRTMYFTSSRDGTLRLWQTTR